MGHEDDDVAIVVGQSQISDDRGTRSRPSCIFCAVRSMSGAQFLLGLCRLFKRSVGTVHGMRIAGVAPMAAADVEPKPSLIGVVRATLRAKHYSPRTEEAYVGWIRRFIRFHGKRHPRTMGETEVVAFLTSLALNSHVAASTQNQALSALVFMYAQVLGVELDWLQGLVRACLLYTSPSPRDRTRSRMPSSA